jgi:hypothetical protein
LCNLPIAYGRVWADCRTITAVLAVDITDSHRIDRPGGYPATSRQAVIVERDLCWPPARPGDIRR